MVLLRTISGGLGIDKLLVQNMDQSGCCRGVLPCRMSSVLEGASSIIHLAVMNCMFGHASCCQFACRQRSLWQPYSKCTQCGKMRKQR